MANLSVEQREQAAQDRIREFLVDLYGEDEMLIVRNTTNGVVSVGFGEFGDKGGMPGGIPRSKLPIVLTDHFPRKLWVESADFRRAVAKGWLIPVSKTEYGKELQMHRDHLAQLSRLAAKDDAKKIAHQPVAPNPFSEDPSSEPMVIDEDTAQMVPASQAGGVTAQRARQFANYENLEGAPRPEDNTPAGVHVMGEGISSRALTFCEEQKRGSLTSQQAIEWLDGEEKLLTEDDLLHIVQNAEFESVKSVARRFLAERS